jgi:hypothetical protein
MATVVRPHPKTTTEPTENIRQVEILMVLKGILFALSTLQDVSPEELIEAGNG